MRNAPFGMMFAYGRGKSNQLNRMTMEKRRALIEIVKDTYGEDNIVEVWNELCDAGGDTDKKVHTWNDFGEFAQEAVRETDGIYALLRAIRFGDTNDGRYWWIDEEGMLRTADFPSEECDSPIDLEMVADYLIEYGDAGLPEVDNDELLDAFLDEHFPGNDDARDIADELIRSEPFDLLTEDWDDLAPLVEIKLAQKSDDEHGSD